MKIAFIVDSFPAISETFILNQITGLIDLGHEVRIFSGSRPTEREFHSDVKKYDLSRFTYYHNEKPENKFVRLVHSLLMVFIYGYKNFKVVINSLNFFKYGKEAVSLNYLNKALLFVSLGPFDIIQCHFGPNGNLGALLKELGVGGKLVTMFHGYDIRLGIENGGGIYKKLFERGDAYLSISDYNYKNLILFGAPADKIIQHPVGIDLRRYSLKKYKNISTGRKVKILTVGRCVKEKGLLFGIQAIEKLIKEHGMRNIQYEIIGDGPLRKQLEEQVEQLNLREYVYFLGSQQQESVIEALHVADIFFLPSIAEALPVVLMEASAVGLPVLATTVGSVGKLILHGNSGFLVSPQDVLAMSEKLAFLINHPEQWAKMGQEGRKHIEKYYDIEELNKGLVSIYQSLIRQKVVQ